jgi:hypothetical protein
MKTYILYEIEQKKGKLNQSTIYVFHWLEKDTLEKYETIVDTSYKNYTRCGWNQIINSTNPYGEYGQLRISPKKTNKNKKVIDADSLPKKYEHMSVDDIIDHINKKKQENSPHNTFNSLFDVV